MKVLAGSQGCTVRGPKLAMSDLCGPKGYWGVAVNENIIMGKLTHLTFNPQSAIMCINIIGSLTNKHA